MSVMDAFNSDVYNSTTLTAAANRIDPNDSQLQRLGLFTPKPISSKTFYVDVADRQLTILKSQARGGPAQADGKDDVSSVEFNCLHFPYVKGIYADSFVGARKWGTETITSSLDDVIAEEMERIVTGKIQRTIEALEMSALQGVVRWTDMAGDSQTESLFTAFGVTEQEVDFETDTDARDMLVKIRACRRAIENKIGSNYSRLHAFVGPTLFDAITDHPSIAAKAQQMVYTNPQNFDATGRIIQIGGVTLEEYTGGTEFLAADAGRIFPVGADIYQLALAPSTMIDGVGAMGQYVYSTVEPMAYQKGVTLYMETNPMPICTRPECLIKIII